MSSVDEIALEYKDDIILSGQLLGFKETRTSHKNVARIRNISTLPQQLEQIPELAVDISTDGDWTRYGLDVRFFHEDISDFVAEQLDIGFREVLALHELLDPFVWVIARHGRREKGASAVSDRGY